MENIIEIRDLSFWYDREKSEIPALQDINLSVKKGEFLVLVGPNGCGKSTLIRHLNGLFVPSKGQVIVDGLDTGSEKNLQEIRRRVGMVFQNPETQLFASVVEEDVAFGVENMCLPPVEIRDRVDKALATVGMSEYINYPPHRLSGGQKQKVAIAGVLAMQPKCIVLDEPTSMLDTRGKIEVLEAVRDLNAQQGITVVYVTHDMTEALLADRLVAISGGRVLFNGKPSDFFTNSEELRRVGLDRPPIIELIESLQDSGLQVQHGLTTPEELVEEICRLNLKM